VTLKVYDILVRELLTLIDEPKTLGFYEVNFDASNFSSGIYFYRIQANEFSDVKKMVLLR
ncbi:MAG: T9SS type A sorting domain-containing protein, partial [Melioribacteraceae bacterium]|nr:T9SS type A sorting domain-containing protein [Melioribacteraceae bacterium]